MAFSYEKKTGKTPGQYFYSSYIPPIGFPYVFLRQHFSFDTLPKEKYARDISLIIKTARFIGIFSFRPTFRCINSATAKISPEYHIRIKTLECAKPRGPFDFRKVWREVRSSILSLLIRTINLCLARERLSQLLSLDLSPDS